MKNKIRLGLMAFAAGIVMVSCNNGDDTEKGNADTVGTGQTSNVDNADADFLSFAAYSGMKEVEQGKVAQQKGMAKEVKDLGKMMVDDHTAMGEKIKALAAQKNVQLKDSLDTDDMDKIRNNAFSAQ